MHDDACPRYRSGSLFGCRWRRLARRDLAEILSRAEDFDRRTHEPGKHGGALGRSALAVLRTLITRFYNHATGELDPSLAAIAKAANVARSTAQEAIARLQACGFIERTRRIVRLRVRCVSSLTGLPYEADRLIQATNGYCLVPPDRGEEEAGNLAPPKPPRSDTGKRSGTNDIYNSNPALPPLEAANPLAEALTRLRRAMSLRAARA